jgi:3-hydroxyisobutyrate dehydrogenase-like beta-hydroxyacid dehydrogenase
LGFVSNAEKREQIFVVDAYVLKGMSELLDGKLMIIASGRSDSITRAQPYLTAMCQNLYTFEGEIGAGRYATFQNNLLVITTTSKCLTAYFLVTSHIGIIMLNLFTEFNVMKSMRNLWS